MCGLVGFIRKKKLQKLDSQLIRTMTNLLVHRGPDSQNYFKIDKLQIGHTRLSIIDQQKSNQPMISDKGNILAFNGEILNFKELKKKYFKGIKFNSNGDTEVLLKGLELIGIDFLKEVRGFFAFAFYIKSKKELILARDHFGIKPLYYYINDKNLVFSSEISPILKFKKFNLNISKRIVFEYLCRSTPPYLETFYKNIFEIEPGSILKINMKKFKLDKVKYYKIENAWKKEKKIKNSIKAQKKISEIFNKSLKRYLIADVKKGVMLSQGIDSSLIYHKIKKKYDNKISSLTYTNDIDYSEDNFVRSFLKKTDLNYKVNANNFFKKVTRKNIIQKLKKGIIEFPINYQFAFSMFELYRLSKKKKIKVLFNGQGADEIFAGYDRFYSLLKLKKLSNKNIYYGLGYQNVNLIEKITNYSSKNFEKKNLSMKWLKNSKLNLRKKMLIFDQKFRLPSLLKLDDYMSMQNSIEVRPLYLNVDFVNYANSLNESYKFSEKNRKQLLQNLFKNKSLLSMGFNKKYGSISSISSWTNSKNFKNNLRELITKKKSLSRKYLNYKKLLDLINIKQTNNLNFIFWSLFNLEIWYQKNSK